ncbi:MAG: IS4 family transposase [Myxococcaceae bacterium]|nr:IS4 family transposase [Myxococcaceae bacterium]MCI0673481.1 IS4 family transposase [Myxococcaceae bacterium]
MTAPLLLPEEVLYPEGCFGPLDEWLRRRLLHTLHLLEGQPGVSLNRLGVSRAERVGAYRMVEHEEVSFQRLLKPAADAVGRAVGQGLAGDVALCVHDRTEVEVSHLLMEDVGTTGNPLCRGFFLQTSLVVEGDGAALGTLAARTWVRPAAERGKAKKRKERPFDLKESAYWWRAMQQAERRVGQRGRLLHTIDAEGDIHELFARADAAGYQVLLRAAQDRRVEGEHQRLWATLEAQPVVDVRAVHVPARPATRKVPAQPARDARLSLRFCPVTLLPPTRAETRRAAQVWAVLARETDAPKGVRPLEWLLLTNVPVESVEAAWGVVEAYRKRWCIEELHKALKTGCSLEGRQHTERKTLENVLALALLASVKLLRLRTLSRTQPDAPATAVLDEDEVAVLTAMAPQLAPGTRLAQAPSLRQAFLLIAALGGYMANPEKRPPGWLVLWHGYERLRERAAGFRLARALAASPPTHRVHS